MRAFSRPSWLLVFVLSLTLIGCSGLPPARQASPVARESAPIAGDASPGSTQPERVLADGSVVGDIRVGAALECLATNPDCDARLKLAREAAIARHGIAPTAIGAAHFYLTYLPPGGAYGGGGNEVVVFDLADGSQAAVTTYCFDGCFVVGPQAVAPLTLEPGGDHGPLVDPFVNAPVECASADHPSCDDAVKVAIAAATTRGFLTLDSIADAHYYVTYGAPTSRNSGGSKAQYTVDIYIAGTHEPKAETSVGVDCGPEPCQVMWVRPTGGQ